MQLKLLWCLVMANITICSLRNNQETTHPHRRLYILNSSFTLKRQSIIYDKIYHKICNNSLLRHRLVTQLQEEQSVFRILETIILVKRSLTYSMGNMGIGKLYSVVPITFKKTFNLVDHQHELHKI